MAGSRDPTYDLSSIVVWSSIEVNTAIICACATTLKPLWRKIVPSRKTPLCSDENSSASHQQINRPMTIGSSRSNTLPPIHDCDILEISECPAMAGTIPRNAQIFNRDKVVHMGMREIGNDGSRIKHGANQTVVTERTSEERIQSIKNGDDSHMVRADSITRGSKSEERRKQDSSIV